MHVCHTILVRGNHYQRKTMKDECSNVLIAVILGYLEFFIIFFFFERLGIYFNPPKMGPSRRLPTALPVRMLFIVKETNGLI